MLIVGGRCAGATLAILLARSGVSTLVADRARFPSDTLSTHVFQGGAITVLDQLGVLDEVLATGAPPVHKGRVLFANGDDRLEAEVPMPSPGPGLPPMLCVRRVALDEVLHRAADRAGATVLDGWSLAELLTDAGRVSGARLKTRDGEERVVHADVVVGADGRSSTVARLVGAREYAVAETERFGYFAYYEGVPRPDPVLIEIVRDERLYGFGVPTDDGLYLACLMAPAADYADFMTDVEGSWEREIARLPLINERVAKRRRVGRPRGLRPVDTYLRDAAGPGWVLTGDSGHFKDPAPGQGIADAMRQSSRLAETIEAGLDQGALDRRLTDWWRWRDRDARPRHVWAHAFGGAGALPHVMVQAQRELLDGSDAPERFWGPSMQLLNPHEALGRLTLARASARAVAAGRVSPLAAVRELAGLARHELAHRRAFRSKSSPQSTREPSRKEALA